MIGANKAVVLCRDNKKENLLQKNQVGIPELGGQYHCGIDLGVMLALQVRMLSLQ